MAKSLPEAKLASDPLVRQRWQQLAAKEALGTITEQEAAKLGRYQALLRPKRISAEIVAEERNSFTTRNFLKEFGRLTRQEETDAS